MDTKADTIRYIIDMALMVISLYCVSFLCKRKIETYNKNLVIFYLALNIVEHIFIINASGYLNKTKGYFMMLLSIIFLACDLYIVYTLHYFSETARKERINDLIIQQSTMQKRAYEELSEKYYESARLVHDIRKHLNSLETLIIKNESEKASEYKNTLLKELDRFTPRFKNENQILSLIINLKIADAEKQNTELVLNIESVDMSFLSDFDITTVFSNLLDNSIEACRELETEKRVITLNIEEHLNFLVIHIRNPYKNIEILPDKNFKSTKEGHMGIGLISVRKTVEKYNGIFKITIDNNQFVVQISIPMHVSD